MVFGWGKSEDPNVLIQQGNFKAAAKLLEARLGKAPHDFSLRMRLAEAYEGDGRKRDAAAIFLTEAEAVLSGGDRNQGLALLRKAARLLPEDGGLASRIAALEGKGPACAGEAFSFDVDMSAAPEENAARPVPPAPAGNVATPPEARAESPGTDARIWVRRLFPELDQDLVARLVMAAAEVSLAPGEVLIREEDRGDSMFIVMHGRLEARGTINGKDLPLGAFGPGDIIGEVAFLKHVPRTATVTATESALVLELPAEKIRAHFSEFPEMQVLLDGILNDRVERTLQLVRRLDKGSDGGS